MTEIQNLENFLKLFTGYAVASCNGVCYDNKNIPVRGSI